VTDGEIAIDDPRALDVRTLLKSHLDFTNSHSPPEDVHALDVDGLLDSTVTFFSFRCNGALLGVAALKQLDEHHAELKSMHTDSAARGRGIARALVDHLLNVARDRGLDRLSLETGSMSAFAPARALYANAGFTPCGPFSGYVLSPYSTFMTLVMNAQEQPAEEVLTGGNVADEVVRVGSTVRKPSGPATPAVEALLEHLADVDFAGAPRTFGRDDRGRHVLEFVPGFLADTLPPMTMSELRRLGRLIRELHDALEGFQVPEDARWDVVIPPDRHDLVCHHDLAPWNLVRDGDRWVFIDWDGAGPGSRLWDLSYAAAGFLPLHPGGSPAADGPRLRALAEGYDLDEQQRHELPALIAAHTRGMYTLLHTSSLTGKQPWARLYAEGHGDHWLSTADYIDEHVDALKAALLA
jgi:GNAT superfamily N-acetyltransferase